MNKFVILTFALVLSACSPIDYDKKMETTKQFIEIKSIAAEAGQGPTDPRLIAMDECEVILAKVYDGNTGTAEARYNYGRDAYRECMSKKGF